MTEKQIFRTLDRYAPLGIPLSSEIGGYLATLLFDTVWSMGIVLRYLEARRRLYVYVDQTWVLIEGAKIAPFKAFIDNGFLAFWGIGIYAIAIMVYHYFYHYQGSKMMYLMKRLPNRWELHKRCFTLPIAAVILAIGYRYLLEGIYYAIYLIFTPNQCLPL